MGEIGPQAKAIIRAVLALGKSLNIPILAEGIETPEQFSMLAREGCDEAQGFLLGRPASLEEIVQSGQITLTAHERLKEIPRAAAPQADLTEGDGTAERSARAALAGARGQ